MVDLVERARAGRRRVIDLCVHGKGGGLMSIPARPHEDIDCLLDDLADEIERLREALSKVAGMNDMRGVPSNHLESALQNALYQCEIIARTALRDGSALDESNLAEQTE